MGLIFAIVVGVAALPILVVIIVGLNMDRAHVATRTAHYGQPASEIWKVLTEVEHFPSWRGDVKRVDKLPDKDGKKHWREVTKFGPIPIELLESVPSKKLVTRIATDELPFKGTWTYDLAEANGGTDLTITEHGEVGNPLFRFLSKYVMGHTATMDAHLRALGKKFGEETTLR